MPFICFTESSKIINTSIIERIDKIDFDYFFIDIFLMNEEQTLYRFKYNTKRSRNLAFNKIKKFLKEGKNNLLEVKA